MSALILMAVLRANVAMSAAILVVLLLRRPLRRRFGALAAYAAWLAAPLCAAASFLPTYSPAPSLAPIVLVAETATRQASSAVIGHPSLTVMLTSLWLVGVAAAFCVFASRQARFLRSLGRLVPFGADRSVLRAEGSGFGPAVIGALRPRIVVPADFEAQVDDRARAVVLTHERVHLERGDPAVNALATALQCLAWFNPLVHLGAHRMRIDQEIACDAVVVARHPEARRLYAEALLNTLLMSRSIPLGCHWPPAGRHPLKERIAMLNSEPATVRRRTIGAALVCGISLLGVGAVWASKPTEPPLVTSPI